MAASVSYVVFFAIISLFYEKDDFASTHAKSLSRYKERRFLILYPAYNEDAVILNSIEKFLYQKGGFAYVMPQSRSVDIDTDIDFKLAEFLMVEMNNR